MNAATTAETNRAGGLEGGMTTGAPLVVRGSMKPLPTLTKPLRSVDIATHEPAEALRERTDSCTVPAAGVVGEAMVAFVLADAYREKFGGDHIDDVRRGARRLRGRIGWRALLTLAARRADRLHRFHGGRQVDRRPAAPPRPSAGRPSTSTAVIERGSGKPIERDLRRRRGGRLPRRRGARSRSSC